MTDSEKMEANNKLTDHEVMLEYKRMKELVANTPHGDPFGQTSDAAIQREWCKEDLWAGRVEDFKFCRKFMASRGLWDYKAKRLTKTGEDALLPPVVTVSTLVVKQENPKLVIPLSLEVVQEVPQVKATGEVIRFGQCVVEKSVYEAWLKKRDSLFMIEKPGSSTSAPPTRHSAVFLSFKKQDQFVSKNPGYTKKGKSRGAKRGKRLQGNWDLGPTLYRMRHGRLPFPPRILVETRFTKVLDMNNAGGHIQANVRFEPTFCYDVDPTVGSTAMPFFTELAGIYRFYRTVKSKIKVVFCSADSNPMTVYVLPMNYDPTVNSANYADFLSNPNSKVDEVCLAQGNSKSVIRHKATTDGIAGSRWTGDADFYSALTAGASAPTNNWFWTVGAVNLSNFANGVFITVVMDVDIVFFEETTPST